MKYFCVVPGLLSHSDCEQAADRFDQLREQNQQISDQFCPSSVSFYGRLSHLRDQIREKYEQVVEKPLYYTYDYGRIYPHGEVVVPHTDRPACEYSVSVNLRNLTEPWEFWCRDPATGQDHSFRLLPGDAILYKGMEVVHWRQPNPHDSVYQAFFHYVIDPLSEHSGEAHGVSPDLIRNKFRQRFSKK